MTRGLFSVKKKTRLGWAAEGKLVDGKSWPKLAGFITGEAEEEQKWALVAGATDTSRGQ